MRSIASAQNGENTSYIGVRGCFGKLLKRLHWIYIWNYWRDLMTTAAFLLQIPQQEIAKILAAVAPFSGYEHG